MIRNNTVVSIWASVLLLVIIISTIAQRSHAQYSGGKGTEADPCQIANVADWHTLISRPVDWDNHFILTADLDFGGASLTPVAPDTSTNNGFQGTAFTGVFDGNSHILRNATIDMTGTVGKDYVGLFGYVGSGGQILNLGVEEVDVIGYNYVGGLVGYNYGMINSCYATGSVNGDDYIGGLVGRDSSTTTIKYCYAIGAVTGSGNCVGGLVGTGSGTIISCYAMGSVSGDDYVGGLVGYNGGTITSSYATGVVSGSGNSVGGLVGYVGNNYTGTILTSFWDMDTSGRDDSLGGKGLTTGQMKTMSIFQNAGWEGKGWVMEDGLDYPHLEW